NPRPDLCNCTIHVGQTADVDNIMRVKPLAQIQGFKKRGASRWWQRQPGSARPPIQQPPTQPAPLEAGMPSNEHSAILPKSHGLVPHFPRRVAAFPEIFEQFFFTQRIHRLPEVAVLPGLQLTLLRDSLER